MDTQILVNPVNIEEGKNLVRALDQAGLRFPVAFWMNLPESNEWRLVFGVPNLKKEGSKKYYQRIDEINKRNHLSLSLGDISLMDTKNEIISLLKNVMQIDNGLVTFLGNSINGQSIPDSIIYRMTNR